MVNAQSQTVVFVGVPSPSLFRSALSAAASPSTAASGSAPFLRSPPPPLPHCIHVPDPISLL